MGALRDPLLISGNAFGVEEIRVDCAMNGQFREKPSTWRQNLGVDTLARRLAWEFGCILCECHRCRRR